MNQAQLDAALNRVYTIPVEISAEAPLGVTPAYDRIRSLADTGLTITLRQLIHAVGSKTASLPSTLQDDCINAALLYTYVLDLNSPYIKFKNNIDSDLQTPRSQELGIGITCLVAQKCFDIQWDQLGALPGPGRRFDYRAQSADIDGIFESKGTSHLYKQKPQIRDGIQKKTAHRERGNTFDVEVIVSTCIGKNNVQPRIIVADPDFDALAETYEKADTRFFRLRHYTRVLQFLGLPQVAYQLNRYALSYLNEKTEISSRLLDSAIRASLIELINQNNFEIKTIGGYKYFGKWFNRVLPSKEKKDRKNYSETYFSSLESSKVEVFQGLRIDILEQSLENVPFNHELLSEDEIVTSLNRIDQSVSIFPDGTIQFFSVK